MRACVRATSISVSVLETPGSHGHLQLQPRCRVHPSSVFLSLEGGGHVGSLVHNVC